MSGVDGSCLCGAVRLHVAFPTRFFAHCHCRSCRKAFGAAIVTWTGVPEGQFTLHDGEGAYRTYASSPGTTRGFCGRCGTSLTFASHRWPGEIHVAVAALDGPLDRPPKGHVYYEHRVDWLTVADPPG